jgi:hypothetical protein
MGLLKNLWRQSPPLTTTAILMLVAFVGSVIGMAVDPRTITGVSAWLKPAKFAISTAIFAGTVAWLFGYLTVKPRVTGWVLTVVLVLEVGIIDVQAARGTTSHFNISSVPDGVLFTVMGAAIAVLWFASIRVFVLLMRQRFDDPAWGWALRLGMLITVLGSAAGGLMLRTTPEQSAAHRLHQQVNLNGGHTVGAPDGGAGLPGVGWSEDHGDLRIPHFFGLHAVQVIPFGAFLIGRRRRATQRVFVAAGSYLMFTGILTWQALRGESIVQPGAETLTALALWAALTAIAAVWTQVSIPRRQVAAL